jgi:CHAT domain-containing protein
MQIAQKTLDGPGLDGPQAHTRLLREWNTYKQRLEAELAAAIPEMSLEQKRQAADRRAVALALPAGVALVEFVRFDVFDFQAVPSRGEPRWQPARYLAFVLPAGKPDHVQLIDLGEAEPIDRMIRDFRAGIIGEVEIRAGRDLGAAPREPNHDADTSLGPALRTAVFDKLVPVLAGCTRLLLAPDGDLTRLPFEVLPTADGRRIIDEYTVSYVSCGRDVLRFGTASNRPPTEPVVAADPDFDLADGREGVVRSDPIYRVRPPQDPMNATSRQSRGLDRGLRFGPLKGTRVEGERIAAQLGVKPWLDATALESRLKACRSPRILHLATHGFFLSDQQREPHKEFRDLGGLPGQESASLDRLSGSGLENPLLRSGLALAGANTWLQNGNPPAEAEDGLLTAEDVSGLDLLDTDLVVLSACETGLGEVRVGEGVFGLRRAFVLAGAKTLVMSLWKVPDQQTQELMEDFYRRLLGGQPRAEALRQAQLALKARYPNPLYWGAFICQGDPAPLPLDDKQKQAAETAPGTLPSPKPAPGTAAKVKWSCPGCGKALRAEKKLTGKRVKCPSCGKVHAVPGTTA